MGFADWDDSYSVGIKKLDDQHKRLFEIINDLNRLAVEKSTSKTYREVMDKLVNYTLYHFRAEEELLRKYEYPFLDTHAWEHEKFKERVQVLYTRCVSEDYECVNQVLEEVVDWLHNHLGKTDGRYGEYFKGLGISA